VIYIFVHAFLFLFIFYIFVYYLLILFHYLFIFVYFFICLFIYVFDYSLIYLATTRDGITAVLKRVAETLWRKLKMAVTCSAIFVDLCIIGWYKIDTFILN
jgi:hypothetical protein